MDNTKRFDGKAAVYEQARPGYAEGLFSYLRQTVGLAPEHTVADIGSGTGKFTLRLLQLGCRVYAVEPNADMRSTAERSLSHLPGFVSVNGTDAFTTLPAGSVDFITAAQSFHWFDPIAFRTECRRILRPGGKVILVWNQRDEEAEINRKSAAICKRYCPQFRGFSGGIAHDPERVSSFFGGEFTTIRFLYPLCYTEEQFLNRMQSSSYALSPGAPSYGAYHAALRALFDRYAGPAHTLLLPNSTVAYIGGIPE